MPHPHHIHKIIFFGTPEFALPSLKLLHENGFPIAAVVTQPDKAQGRSKKLLPPPVKVLAEELGIEVFQPNSIKKDEFLSWAKSMQADLHLVVAYGKIFPKALLELPKLTLNVHASLLPRWRGAAPIARAIEHGDRHTGVSIMKLVEKMDAGDYCLQKTMPIDSKITKLDLEKELSTLGAQALQEALEKLQTEGLSFRAQDESLVTHAPPVEKVEGLCDWRESAELLSRKCRAFFPWPNLFSFDGKQSIKIIQAQVSDPPTESPSPISGNLKDAEPGTLIHSKKQLWVKTGQAWLEVLELQLQGKRPMPTHQFLPGYGNQNIQQWLLPEAFAEASK